MASGQPGATPPRDTTFSIAIDTEPSIFSPAASDAGTRLVNRFLFDALYRLDDRTVARPDLAAGLPFIPERGTAWTVSLKPGVQFHDGTRLGADDVAFTYQLALSPNCPWHELCPIAQDGLAAVAVADDLDVTFTLREPATPLLATLLAQLAIVPRAAVQASEARLLRSARKVGSGPVTDLIESIDVATGGTSCGEATPPAGCALAAHTDELEALLRRAGVTLPYRGAFTDGTGGVDAEAYAAALLRQAQLLAATLSSSGTERTAAAFPLLDFGRRPVGTGAFRLRRYRPGEAIDLVRVDDARAAGSPVAAVAAVHVTVIADPRIAATALQTGAVDWLPSVSPEQVAELSADPALRIEGHPGPSIRMIVFNTRPGRVYADVVARRAFAMCIDRERAVRLATGGGGLVAWTPITPGTWASPEDLPQPPGDASGARGLLDASGYVPGTDSIYARDGQRLTSQLFVRASRGDELDFATEARDELRACGIELTVRELDVSGGALLDQLQWPNDFDTLLVTRELAVDPQLDLEAYEGRHVTTEANPGDLDIGGWSDVRSDALLQHARGEQDPARRAAVYAEVQRILVRDVPVIPLWYELRYAALSRRVSGPQRTIDLHSPGYAWDVDRWQLIGP